ncbi:S8 family peptidase [Allorhizocola rhizosphaerae]|uniref:S8 family peptidase n=1 Tax=Allorhizocola rhizosphaerae TaxID=1872709 RepID=UPI000E3CDBB9|nr:S8 family peptidase [Allorhizocola rhizosphaerae]
MKLRLFALTCAALTAAAAVGTPAAARPADGIILAANSPTAIAGSYIVVLNDVTVSDVDRTAVDLAARYSATVRTTWTHALRGFHANMSATQARRLAADPAVKYVEQDQIVTGFPTQSPTPSWGLDRIDARSGLDNSYTFPNNGSGVTAYIIDTGIRVSHSDFGGRAVWGTNTTGDGNNTDCHGHGTHVASTTGGTAYGVAKGVSLVAVKVLNCAGSGSTAGVNSGINYVTQQHTTGAAVANMSLGGGFSQSQNDAVTASIADGVTYAIAAGNSNANACNTSPASTPNAITLGATQNNDARASFSNFGTCLDLFAPGVSITAAWSTSDSATNTISGTSMASPHAAGVAAIIKAANPSFTPLQVRDKMVADATSGVVTSPGTGSPNLLLFVNNGTQPPGTTLFEDTFETNLGWQTNPNGTDTATTGAWERGDPAQTSSGVTLQLGTTVSGTNDLVTGAAAGTGAGSFDVDGGTTSARSPAVTLSGSGTFTLSYSWYLAHLSNSSNTDFFRISIVHNGGTTTMFSQLGAATDRAGAWATRSTNISAYAGQAVRILVECVDASGASLVECGVDDVRIVHND